MNGIAVLIVNYGSADLALAAVASVLERDHGGRHVEIHLVDNASPGDDAAHLKAEIAIRGWQNEVTLYAECENHGFARGNNLVLRHLAARSNPPELVFFLNPDAALKNEAVAELADFLDRHPRAGIAGARVEKPGTGLVTAAFRFPSLIGEFAGALAFGPVVRLFAHKMTPMPAELPTRRVDWVVGAALMARFRAVAEIDFFDPGFFLYFEEVDICRRAAAAGWQTWHVAEAEVLHLEGASTGVHSGQLRRRPAYWYRSWARYFRKSHGRAYALGAALAWMSGAALNHLLAKVASRRPAAPRNLFTDFWAVAGRPLLGMEARNYD